MPTNSIDINVHFNQKAVKPGVAADTDPTPGLTPNTPFDWEQATKKVAKFAFVATATKRVASFGLNRLGEITGNEEMERRIKDDIATARKFANPTELIANIVDFKIDEANSREKARFNAFFSGNLTGGGR